MMFHLCNLMFVLILCFGFWLKKNSAVRNTFVTLKLWKVSMYHSLVYIFVLKNTICC